MLESHPASNPSRTRTRSRALFALATLTTTSSAGLGACRRATSPAAAPSAEPSSRRAGRVATAGAAGGEIGGAVEWGGLRARTVGERKNPRQVVILLHGWGAPGDDLVPLGHELAAPGRLFVFPAAPLVSPGGGRAWWHLDMERLMNARARGGERDLRAETPDGLAEARAQVQGLLAEVTRRAGVPPSSVLLGGFSQGAMLATDVTLAEPGAVGGLVVMSGSLLSEAAWTARMGALPPAFPIFMSHGRGDPVLPFRGAEALRDLFGATGHRVDWVPFDGGHGIPMPVLDGVRAFLATFLAARERGPA